MKRWICLTLILAMTVTLLCACGSSGAGKTETESQTLDYKTEEVITTSGIVDFDLTFTLMPEGYADGETENKGTLTTLYYTTDAYGDGVTYEKFVRVYLPYGYDANDTATKYNILYFQHGSEGAANEFFGSENSTVKKRLDNLFDPENGAIEPYIIVFTTYYMESEETATTNPEDALSGDGHNGNMPNLYYKEVVEDIIPQIEAQLNGYCDDFSEEGIIASRDHRAWSGYSRGGVCSWYIFQHDLPYFRYYLPMSGAAMPEVGSETGKYERESGSFTVEEAFQYLKDAIDAYPEYDFFIYSTAGGVNDAASLKEQLAYDYTQTDTFSYGKDPSANNFYFACSDFAHGDPYMVYTLYDAKDVLFY